MHFVKIYGVSGSYSNKLWYAYNKIIYKIYPTFEAKFEC